MTEVVQRPLYNKSSSHNRMPLQSRNPNTIGGLASFNNSSTEEYNSKEIRLSNLEHSNNENNKRLMSSASYAGSSLRRSSSTAEVRDAAAGEVPATTGSRGPVAHHTSSLPPPSVDEDTVIIEEKRRRINGEGFTLHRYLRGRLLGKGGFAKVYLCTALDTNKAYAIKIVPKANLVRARARQKLQAEIKIHRMLKHKHVCEYKHFFEDRQNCYILLELCHNQSLNEMIKRRKRLTEPEAAFFGQQLLMAMKYLHQELVIHRDLKLGNLFLDRNMNVKVGDLGLATKLETADEKRKTICGTPNYIAPEVIQGDRATRGHSFEVDIWSMGVILYTCMCGRPPYEAKDVKATYQRILANDYSFPRDVDISDDAKDLIRSLLQSKPSDRPSLEAIGKHPFFTGHFIPETLPSTATHLEPRWDQMQSSETSFGKTWQKCDPPSKPGLPLSGSQRRPFGARDVNVDSQAQPRISLKKASATDAEGTATQYRQPASTGLSSQRSTTPAAQAGFTVFDESNDKRPAPVDTGVRSDIPSSAAAVEDEIVNRTAAMSIRVQDASPMNVPLSRPSSTTSASTQGTNAVEHDAVIFQNMIGRIETVLDIASRRSYSHVHPESPSLTAFSSGGPTKWVSRYVDYTSKYGLGFLLNDGSSGVYFNDSTKTVLEATGDTFHYIERKRPSSDVARRGEPVIVEHSLTSFPDDLQKKVTLLKHFRNYLIEQENEDSEGTLANTMGGRRPGHPMVYLKKWVRTKHAIFFRLSDQTVQIVFYDHTEVLLTPDERHFTYVDKQRNRSTYFLTDELVGCNQEIAKRLKYTKEILQQLVSGQKSC
eukprot:Nitzschia sp. Nitz4//scaffold11_size288233//172946//175554//NITZ4_000786-RA/size288233-snap-gene-0.27-mRNA-1//1//CDS//3329534110//2454//frame0